MNLLLAITLTLRFASWHLPALITLGSFVAFVVIAWLESRDGGDFSIPIFSFVAFGFFFAATLVSWTVFFLS